MSQLRDGRAGESMSQVFDRLVDLTQRMADANPEPQAALPTSERETSAADAAERVHVVIRDYKVTSVSIDHMWFHRATLDEVEAAVQSAVNAALDAYLGAEFAEAADTHYGIEGVHEGLRQLSEDFNAAFERRLDEITAPRRAQDLDGPQGGAR